jgi:hypothetical protein
MKPALFSIIFSDADRAQLVSTFPNSPLTYVAVLKKKVNYQTPSMQTMKWQIAIQSTKERRILG